MISDVINPGLSGEYITDVKPKLYFGLVGYLTEVNGSLYCWYHHQRRVCLLAIPPVVVNGGTGNFLMISPTNPMEIIDDTRTAKIAKPKRRALSGLDLIEALAGLELGYLFNYLALKEIAAYFSFKRYPHRSFIYKVGDERDMIYGLIQGYVKVMRQDRHGHQALIDIFAPGVIFGEDALYLTGPRDRTIQAHEDVVVVQVSKSDFQELINRHPTLYDYVFRTIGERLKRTEDRVVNLSLEAVPGRLAKVLSEMAFRYGTVRENGSVMINLKLPHREIAELVGSTRESVTAHLNDLRRRELIEISERHIVINDLAVLSGDA